MNLGTGSGIRTHTSLRPTDFESVASAIPPPRLVGNDTRSDTYHRYSMDRREQRIFRLNDEIERLEAELSQARTELDVHRHLADDAARDVAVSNSPIDREEARETSADVDRFERVVEVLGSRIVKISAGRDRLIHKLD